MPQRRSLLIKLAASLHHLLFRRLHRLLFQRSPIASRRMVLQRRRQTGHDATVDRSLVNACRADTIIVVPHTDIDR